MAAKVRRCLYLWLCLLVLRVASGGGESRNVLKAIYLASAFSVRFQEGPGVSQKAKVRYSKVGTYRTLARG